MIGLLIGKIALRLDPYIILNVNNVGYKVYVSSVTFASLQSSSEEITVFIHTHVREDMLDLYGFLDPADLKLFEYLIDVSGIGCKTAMGIFSIGKRSDIVNAITAGDVDFFTSVPRLGKKNAQKIIIELKSKLGSVEDLDLSEGGSENATVIAALKQFGYTTVEANAALRAVGNKNLPENEMIRLALKSLGK
ncbi:MAG TPA: Holliday junction branch migration protein RuvA [Patescibacteria group bacterium]|nr:Holliday junction branch migration protein RuvA [Patescibacteria group bacterium]